MDNKKLECFLIRGLGSKLFKWWWLEYREDMRGIYSCG